MGCNKLYGNTDIITTRLFNLVDNCMSIYLNIYTFVKIAAWVNISFHIKEMFVITRSSNSLKYFTYDNYVIDDN